MIDRLYRSIAAGLKEIRPCKIYVEDVPQNFTQPSFLITFYEQNPTHGINGKLKNTVGADVSYFPETDREPYEECWHVGEELSREFVAADFKIRNRNLKIVDDVLHFLFDVDYREYFEESTQTMRTMSQDTEMKEE